MRSYFLNHMRHIVILSLTITGFPNMMAAMGWVNEVLESDLDEKLK